MEENHRRRRPGSANRGPVLLAGIIMALLVVGTLQFLAYRQAPPGNSAPDTTSRVTGPARQAESTGRPIPGEERPGPDGSPPTIPASRGDPPASVGAGATSQRVQRFPVLDAPTTVPPAAEFTVQVWLSETALSSATRIDSGVLGDSGRVAFDLPISPDHGWTLDVVVTAPGFEIRDGKNAERIRLPERGDSSPAAFHLVAIPTPEIDRSIHATLWHDGEFLTRFHAVVRVTSEPVTAGAQSVASPAIRIDPDEGSIPDLTLLVLSDFENGRARSTSFVVDSPHLQIAEETIEAPPDAGAWMASVLDGPARGRLVETDAAPSDSLAGMASLRGFGRELYRRSAPAIFRSAFWKLRDRLGDRFDTIQIYFNDPAIPWELMCPFRDGGEDDGFLSVRFRIARWQLNAGAEALERPPQVIPVRETVFLAPDYDAGSRLPGAEMEARILTGLPGFRRIETANSVAALRDKPRGILHFAGHGERRTGEGRTPDFILRLGDRDIDPVQWRGLVSGSDHDHPLVFFNACDLGRVDPVCGFVDGWAPALLESGAGGFIGGLWPLDDRMAALFAEAFYTRVRSGLADHGILVAEALREARGDRIARGDPTCLAYVLYGSPSLRLVSER